MNDTLQWALMVVECHAETSGVGELDDLVRELRRLTSSAESALERRAARFCEDVREGSLYVESIEPD